VQHGQATAGGPIEGDATGGGFLKSHIREDYATLLSTLDERHAIVFGRASSCTDPVLVRPNEASEIARLLFVVDKSEARTRPSQARPARLLSPGMCWRWSGWSRLWKAWPELLHDAADSG
jgi:hypothetical protein